MLEKTGTYIFRLNPSAEQGTPLSLVLLYGRPTKCRHLPPGWEQPYAVGSGQWVVEETGSTHEVHIDGGLMKSVGVHYFLLTGTAWPILIVQPVVADD